VKSFLERPQGTEIVFFSSQSPGKRFADAA
jgi:hypothetical protein